MTTITKNNKNQLIVKSNQLIEASYRLTLQEQRIILYMSSLINKGDDDFKVIRLEVREFASILGIQFVDYNDLEKITKGLLSKVLEIKEQKGKEKTTLQIGWLSSVKYFHNEGSVELSFDPKLKPYLLLLKEKFTKYQFQQVIQLKRVYSIRFYELLKQYEPIGNRYFDLDELKKILGISENEYKKYANFKAKVLDPTKKEFKIKYDSDEIDFTFDYKQIKRGRRVHGIDFIILQPKKKQKKIALNNLTPIQKQSDSPGFIDLIQLLPDEYSIKCMPIIKKYLKTRSPEYIKKNIQYTNQKEPDSYVAYLTEALKDDYASSYEPNKELYRSHKKAANKCFSQCKGNCAATRKGDNQLNDCYHCKKFK